MIGFGVVAALLAVLLKQYRPEYAMGLSILAGILILKAVFSAISPYFSSLETYISDANLPLDAFTVLIKALGICTLTQIACDHCRDAGENAIAGKLELAGKVCITILIFPLFQKLFDFALRLI